MARPPLVAASAWNENPQIVEILIEAGADVRARYDQGETALMYVAERFGTEAVEVLLQAGSDVSVRDYFGITPLIRAAGNTEYPQVVTKLIDEGADVNARNARDQTVLIYVAIFRERPGQAPT